MSEHVWAAKQRACLKEHPAPDLQNFVGTKGEVVAVEASTRKEPLKDPVLTVRFADGPTVCCPSRYWSFTK